MASILKVTEITTPDGTGNITVSRPIGFDNIGSAPDASANTSFIYAKDVSSSSEVHVKDENGNETQISPHNPDTGEWEFYSKNIKTGRVVKIKMEKMMKKLDTILGGGFYEEYIDKVIN
jgi:hypothetical protein